MRDNKGFTLFEMMMVLALSAIVIGMAGLSISAVNRANVSKAANKYLAAVELARNISMAQGDAAGTLHIVKEGGQLKYYIGPDSTKKEVIATPAVKVSTTITNALFQAAPSDSSVLANGTSLEWHFNTAGMVKSGSPMLLFTFWNNGKKVVSTYLYNATGKTDSVTYYR